MGLAEEGCVEGCLIGSTRLHRRPQLLSRSLRKICLNLACQRMHIRALKRTGMNLRAIIGAEITENSPGPDQGASLINPQDSGCSGDQGEDTGKSCRPPHRDCRCVGSLQINQDCRRSKLAENTSRRIRPQLSSCTNDIRRRDVMVGYPMLRCLPELIRTISLASLGILASCQPEGLKHEIYSGEQQIIELDHRQKLLSYRLEQTGGTIEGDIQRATQESASSAKRICELTDLRHGVLQEIKQLEKSFGEFKSQAIKKRREVAMGMQFDQLVVRNGRSFEKVRVVSIDDAGVSIRHSCGAARLRHGDLTESQQTEFGIEACLAAAAERRELEANASYENWLAREMSLASTAKDGKPAEASRMLATARATSGGTGNLNAGARTSLLAQPARPFGTGSLYRLPRYRSYDPYYQPVRYYQPLYINYPACSGVGRQPTGASIQFPPPPRGISQGSTMPPACRPGVNPGQ